MPYRYFSVLLASLCWLGLTQAASADDAAKEPSFEKDVAPLLTARCVKCHGANKLEGGLDLRRRFLMAKGGDSGAAIVPGKPDESLLLQRITAGEMPPDKPDRLSESQVDLLRRWLASGAKTVGEKEAPLEDTEITSRVTAEDRQFWSFRTPTRPAVPIVQHTDRVRTPIDAFLLAKLEAQAAMPSLSFNRDADKPVLIRRLYMDLLGLPPTTQQLDEFMSDTSHEAYERLVDRLLASPAYGERWGRHWLDVAGYADSDGYLAADRLRPEAWRYRDYVIRALNADLPYDRFLVEQVAGDEITDWRRASELTPEMIDGLVATGFLRTALDPTYPGYTEPNEIHQVLADTMQIVSTSLLGLTVHCARCHSHKFDPVSQRDYYGLMAVFTPSFDPARWQPSEVRGIALASEAQQARITEQNQKADARIAELLKQFAELQKSTRLKRLQHLLGNAASELTVDVQTQLVEALAIPADKRNAQQKMLVSKHGIQESFADAELEARYPEFKEESSKLKAAAAAEGALKKNIIKLRGLADLDDKPAMTHIFRRGDYSKLGTEVSPSVPEVLVPASHSFAPQASYKSTGRRTEFAKWLTDPLNPLTARVHVNRAWAHFFGKGIVPTLANFGRSGAKPTHPELLDWLATEFIRSGWSQKALHRLLVTSTVYRQSSELDSTKSQLDPNNVWLSSWPSRRVEGEVVRDSMLAVADKLHVPMFGSPSPVALQGDGSVITADDAASNRRSIYLIVRRSQHLTLLDLFDTPMMETNCTERKVSIVPLQALAMLNGPFAERAATALADRVLRDASNDADRIDLAYRGLMTRTASAHERQAIADFLASVLAEQLGAKLATATDAEKQAATRAAWIQAALVLLNTSEFLYLH